MKADAFVVNLKCDGLWLKRQCGKFKEMAAAI